MGLGGEVEACSEVWTTGVLESAGPGGQAGRSMRIENYLGFPTGITGSELAERAAVQARKFGARIEVPTQVIRLTFDGTYPTLHIDCLFSPSDAADDPTRVESRVRRR